MFEIHVGELRATFLRNHNMRRHKDPKRKTTQAQKTPTTATSTGALHPIRGTAPVTWRCTRYVALHPNRRGVMPTDRVHCLLEQVKVWSAVARSGLCGLMGVCVVVPGGGFRQTVDPFTKIPRNLAVFAQWVCTLAEWMLHRYGCASWSVLGTKICGVGWSVGVWNGLVVVSILPRKRIRDKACC